MNIDRNLLKNHDTPESQRRTADPSPETRVTINISMPKLKRPSIPKWPWRKLAVYTGVVVGMIVLGLIIHAAVTAVIDYRRENAAKNRIDMIEQRQAPTFKPLVPKDKASAVTKTAAYDAKRDSYSYNDTFKGVGVVVSQQRLPKSADATTVAKIAKSMNATTPIIAGGSTAYLASDAAGAQTVVMSSGSVLVFIQSSFAHSVDDWKGYLDTLQS